MHDWAQVTWWREDISAMLYSHIVTLLVLPAFWFQLPPDVARTVSNEASQITGDVSGREGVWKGMRKPGWHSGVPALMLLAREMALAALCTCRGMSCTDLVPLKLLHVPSR